MIESKSSRRPWGYSDWIAVGLCVLGFGIIFSMLIYKYRIFGYYDWDLALFSQGMHVISHGKSYMSLYGVNFLGNHANFIAYFLIPFFKIFPSPIFLLFLKSTTFAASAFILYILAKDILVSSRGAIVILILYLIYPPNLFAQLFEFDFENLAPLFFMGMFYFFRSNQWLGFALCSLGAILIKENIPLVVGMFGIYGLFVKRPKWLWGVVPFVVGFGVCYVLVRWGISWLAWGDINGQYNYLRNYEHIGLNGPQDYWAVFSNLMADESRQEWLLSIFAQFFILPFLSPQILMLGAPLLAQHFFSAVPHEHDIAYQYVYTLSPFIFLAVVQSLSYCKQYDRKKYVFIFGLIVFLGLLNLRFAAPDLQMRLFPSGFSQVRHLVSVQASLARSIPQDAPVVASFCFLPALSQRDSLFAFYKTYAKTYQVSQWPFRLPDNVRFALVDLGEAWIDREFKDNFLLSQPKIEGLFAQGWAVKKSVEDIVLFEKGDGHNTLLVRHSFEPLNGPANNLDLTIGGDIKLLGIDAKAFNFQDQVLPLVFYWKAHTDIEEQYIVEIVIQKDKQKILRRVHRIGYALYPTQAWKKGEWVNEQFNVYWPGGPVEGADLAVRFYKLAFPLDLDVTRSDRVRIQGKILPKGSDGLVFPNFTSSGKGGI